MLYVCIDAFNFLYFSLCRLFWCICVLNILHGYWNTVFVDREPEILQINSSKVWNEIASHASRFYLFMSSSNYLFKGLTVHNLKLSFRFCPSFERHLKHHINFLKPNINGTDLWRIIKSKVCFVFCNSIIYMTFNIYIKVTLHFIIFASISYLWKHPIIKVLLYKKNLSSSRLCHFSIIL